jgi:DNA-binding MarR family transcriptional regulator
MTRPDDLERLDAALMRLRRLWTAPRTRAGMRAGDDPVELSTVLVVDALARGPHHHVGVADVAERLDVTPSTASRLVDRAVAAGMVERRVAPDDARRADLALTEAGAALHGRARTFRTRYLGAVLNDWNASDVATLADHLDRFARAVTDAAPPPPQENP